MAVDAFVGEDRAGDLARKESGGEMHALLVEDMVEEFLSDDGEEQEEEEEKD